MATPQIDPQHLKEVALVLKDMPLAGTCALLVVFMVAMAGYILLLQRTIAKNQRLYAEAEKEDTEAKFMLGEAIVRLSSRIGRVLEWAKLSSTPVPENGEDDDKTIFLADILKGERSKK